MTREPFVSVVTDVRISPEPWPTDTSLQPRVVTFGNAARLYIDPTSRLAALHNDLFEALKTSGGLAYVIPTSGIADHIVVESVLIPSHGHVLAVEPTVDSDDMLVVLDASASLLRIDRRHADVERLMAAVVSGEPVAVTWRPEHSRIISVDSPVRTDDGICETLTRPMPSCDAIVAGLRGYAPGAAAAVLANIAARVCDPRSPNASCLAFNNATNGCWVTAAVVCDELRHAGIDAAKYWIYSDNPSVEPLQPHTRNLPHCAASWRMHVAVLVRNTDGALEIVDPVIFPCNPVPLQRWLEALNCRQFNARVSDHTAYFAETAGQFAARCGFVFRIDSNASRAGLAELFRTRQGPPFPHCQIDPCGPI